MTSLIEIPHGTLRECKVKFAKMQAIGEVIVQELKMKTIEIPRKFRKPKIISVWDSLVEVDSWVPISTLALRLGFLNEGQANCVSVVGREREYQFLTFTKYGVSVFLSASDYRSLKWILETEIA